jgi:hypothetical protein
MWVNILMFILIYYLNSLLSERDTEDVNEVTCIPLSIDSLWVVFIKVFFIFTVKA